MKKGSFAHRTFFFGRGGGSHATFPPKNGCEGVYNSYFMARLQASPSLLYGRPATLVHGKILCSMTAVYPGADPGGCRGCSSLPPEMPCGFLIQLVFCIKICLRHQSVTPFLSGATRPKKNPGSPLPDILRQRGRPPCRHRTWQKQARKWISIPAVLFIKSWKQA